MNNPPTLLLIDLECTCNDDPPLPKGESEIIEIGMVLGQLGSEGFSVIDELQEQIALQLESRKLIKIYLCDS